MGMQEQARDYKTFVHFIRKLLRTEKINIRHFVIGAFDHKQLAALMTAPGKMLIRR